MKDDRDIARLRTFWNERYATFALGESGWFGAPAGLNERAYDCKVQALRRAIAALGLSRDRSCSVLDAGCGQGYFARFYRKKFPAWSYTGVDISARAAEHLRQTMPGGEFHEADLCTWRDPHGRTFDLIQSIEVLHLMLDDEAIAPALSNLASQLAPGGALLLTVTLSDQTLQISDYLRFRSRDFWHDTFAQLGLRVLANRPMYYWLPGGPANKYLRYAFTRLGPGALYYADRAALAIGLPQPASIGIDSRMRLLTLQRA